MKSNVAHTALAAVLLLGVACGGRSPAQDEGTAAATRDLLESSRAKQEVPSTGSLPPGRPVAPKAPEAADQPVDLNSLGVNRGDQKAPVRIVEFSDYGCGYCRKFHEETWPVLVKDFVDAGKVEWKFLPFVSGMFKNSQHALAAAECALEQGDDVFEDMNGRIWDRQQDWKRSSDAAPVLRDLASESGLDMDRYDGCISQGRRDRRMAAENRLARDVGVRGTPTFFIMGYPPLQGALPTETFHKVLEMVYADATKDGGN